MVVWAQKQVNAVAFDGALLMNHRRGGSAFLALKPPNPPQPY